MTNLGLAAALGLSAIFVSIPAYDRAFQVSLSAQAQHDHAGTNGAQDATAARTRQDMMASMAAADAKLDEMVRTMNTAKGEAKIDAVAALLTALVEQHRTMRASMANMMAEGPMMNRMKMMGGMPAPAPKPPDAPNK